MQDEDHIPIEPAAHVNDIQLSCTGMVDKAKQFGTPVSESKQGDWDAATVSSPELS